MAEERKVVPFDTTEDEAFRPDVAYVKFAYLDRRDFVAQIRNEDRLPDSVLEEEFNEWLEGIQAQAWLKGYNEHAKLKEGKL